MPEFAENIWLLLLPVPVAFLLFLFWIDRKGRRTSIRRFASGRLVSDLLDSYSPARKRLKNVLLLIAVALLFLALARPQWGHTWSESRSRGIDLVFALDTSRSMLAQDIRPNRLIRAKLAIEDFVRQLEGDRIGLVAFSGSAFLQCPLTLDYDAFFQSLDAIDTNVISAGGTDISAALQEAESAFSADNNYKILILITDGEDLAGSGIEQARKAARNGVTVYTVGVGTADGAPIPIRSRTGAVQYVRDEDGSVVQSRLDTATLETIAEETDGFYVNLGPTGAGLEQVLEAGVGSIPEEEITSSLQRTAIERYQWPLAAALALLVLEPLIGTRRTRRIRVAPATASLVAVAVAGLGFPSMSAEAQEAAPQVESVPEIDRAEGSEPEAEEEVPETAFARAVYENPGEPVAHFNWGTELYREGDYEEATEAFTDAIRLSDDLSLQADVFYNLGNTRFQDGAGDLRESAPQTAIESARSTITENQPPMGAGEQILNLAQEGQVPPQQRIQGAIQALEQRSEATEDSLKTLENNAATLNTTRTLWQRSVNDFESALELRPDHEDARHNLSYVKEQTAELTKLLRRMEELSKTQTAQMGLIDELVEELKKLLEQQQNQDDQQQSSQDQQQEDNQSESENQESQSGGESGDQSEQNEKESGSDGNESQEGAQSGEDAEGAESNKSPSSENGEPDQQSGESSDGEEAETQDEGDSGSEEQPSSGESGEDTSGQPGEKSRDGEAGSEETESGEPIQLGEEQAGELAAEREEAEATAGATAGEQGAEGEGEEVVIGVMSAEDAARLLDSLKNSERKLPFAGSGSEGTPDQRNRRNW